jgi:hypothetical protein
MQKLENARREPDLAFSLKNAGFARFVTTAFMNSETARALAARRKIRRGGKKPTCTCGECRKCLNREAVARHRAERKFWANLFY